MVLLLLAACHDYSFSEPEDNSALNWFDVPEPELVAWPDPYRLCDTWEADLLDGVGTDESCIQEYVYGDLEAVVEWRIDQFKMEHQFGHVVMAPVVGQMTDDNGDGVIDRNDTPDLFIVSDQPNADQSNSLIGAARLISGSDGTEHWADSVIVFGDAQVYPYRYSNAALGDIDNDGEPEIVLVATVHGEPTDPGDDTGPLDTEPPDTETPDTETPPDDTGTTPIDGQLPDIHCYPVALSAIGEVEWIGWDAPMSCGGHAPALADLDADGDVEVVVGAAILKGTNGRREGLGLRGSGRGSGLAEMGSIPAIVDLDGDGQQEILAGNSVYGPDGDLICSTGTNDGYTAAADLDLDGQGEFVLVTNGRIRIFEADCTQVGGWALAGDGHGGPPTIADFDSDGTPEIGVAEALTYSVYEVDGTERWSAAVQDASSHATGSVVFDFEGDGRPEVVYADETTLWVFDGETGAVRMQDGRHESRTLHEFPTVVDIDGDGVTEILVPNGGTHGGANSTGIYVLGSAGEPWLGNRQVWNQHAYNITNINDDLSIPSPATSNWPDHNNFRSGDPNPPPDGTASDVLPLVDVCDLECPVGQIALHVRLANRGMGDVRANVPVSVYAIEPDGYRYLASAHTDAVIAPGQVSDTLVIRVNELEVPTGELVVVADDYDGAPSIRECNEDNNFAVIEVRCE